MFPGLCAPKTNYIASLWFYCQGYSKAANCEKVSLVDCGMIAKASPEIYLSLGRFEFVSAQVNFRLEAFNRACWRGGSLCFVMCFTVSVISTKCSSIFWITFRDIIFQVIYLALGGARGWVINPIIDFCFCLQDFSWTTSSCNMWIM